MNLIVDIGNTRIKAAVFENAQLKSLSIFESSRAFLAAFKILPLGVSRSILSSVTEEYKNIFEHLSSLGPCLLFEKDTPVPIGNKYQSVASLGSDRLAAAVGASAQFPKTNVLNIDTGTCIKYNFINSSGDFLGGAISPGLKMRINALHTFTARLPLVDFNANYCSLIGKTTSHAILSGTQVAAVLEADAFISEYKKLYPDLTVIISGGDTDFFEKQLKNSIFARPNLVLEGLNKILDNNA